MKFNDLVQVPHVYCIGDANGKMMLAHAASAQGISGTCQNAKCKHKKDANEHHINVFVCFNVVIEQLSGKEHVLNHLSIPAACFTHPEISMVGLTEVTVFLLVHDYQL